MSVWTKLTHQFSKYNSVKVHCKYFLGVNCFVNNAVTISECVCADPEGDRGSRPRPEKLQKYRVS